MKKSDIAMIILIAGISVVIAFFIANSIPALKPSDKGVKVKTIESISSDINDPDKKVFNKDAINPTVQTVIGGANEPSQ